MAKKEKSEKKSKKNKKGTGKGSGFQKEYYCSEALAAVVGSKTITRPQMTSKIWGYIKKHKLQDEDNGQIINPDKKLAAVLGKKPLKMFAMTKALGEHLS